MRDGYIVLEKNEWRDWELSKLNSDTLKKILEDKKKQRQKATRWDKEG